MKTSKLMSVGVFCAIALGTGSRVAAADAVADFYQGKQITMYIGVPPSGAYDIYARVIARFMGNYLPGNPTFIPKNRPGAASLALMNDLYNVLPQDGTAVGAFTRSIALEQLLGRPHSRFDPTKVNWLGSANNETSVCAVWHTAGIKTPEEFMTRPVLVAGTAPGAETDMYPTALNNLVGTKFKIITGYPGANDLTLAMERGETQGRCGWTWSSLVSTSPDLLEQHKVAIMIQLAAEKHPDLPNVPLATDFAKRPQDRQALELIFSSQIMGRPFAAPPNVPADRLKALRDAFDATMKDAEFRAMLTKQKLDVAPVSGTALQALIVRMFQTPEDVVQLASDAITRTDRTEIIQKK
jgi:tripartite-type tricarboxylate transporter receptor subunit TctC